MPIPKEVLADLKIGSSYARNFADALNRIQIFSRVDILVVVDTEIATEPGIGFGVGTVIELIRSTRVGCMRFRVDIAERSGGTPTVVASPAPFGPKYTGFRFDMTNNGTDVIDRYEQIWCFGFKPDNSGGPDANIDQPSAFPASDAELAKLASWMKDRKGGLFATGDHDYLGASMCRRFPRIGTMRLWTNADGVPPIGTPARIDTLRPPSPAYEPSAPGGPAGMSNTPHQGDLTPQPIQWVPWRRIRHSIFFERSRPHPVLCHPTLGPIDVMPDHAHEGLCRDTGTVPLGGTYNFDGAGAQPEYPNAVAGGARPEPVVIAYGSTLGSPPYNFTKGPQPARAKFPMISVYDGHRAGVGRCATDSTWHHWMDVNIGNIKSAGGADWDKIGRYYVNLAVWLTPPGFHGNCLYFETLVSHFQPAGFQEYSYKLSDVALGRSLKHHLWWIYGPFWVTQVVYDILELLEIRVFEESKLPDFPVPPDPCLTCPPWDWIEEAVLGGLVRASFETAEQIKQAASAGKKAPKIKTKSLEKLMLHGVKPALQNLAKDWRADMKRTDKLLKRMAG